MRVLLSGGSGFVGRHLGRLLGAQGHEVFAPTSDDWNLRNADRTFQAVAAAAPELVVHLAAHTGLVAADGQASRVRAINVEGTQHLLDAVASEAREARILVVSTCHVYGPPQTLPVTEEHPLAPVGVYASTKRDAETRTRASGLDWVIVRPFHLVGPGQPPTHAASDWARQAAMGAQVIHCGNLDLARDLLDVRDACQALIRLAEKAPSQQTFNVCRGEGWLLRDVLETVAPGVSISVDPSRLRSHDVVRLVGDASRLRDLGWVPQVSVTESLRALRKDWDRTF